MTSSLLQLARENIQSEATRIVNLPVISPLDPEEVALVSSHYCPSGQLVLRPSQANAMVHYHRYSGLVAPLPVGEGKSLVSALIASDAYSVFGKKKIILVCPTNLTHQFKNVELPKYRRLGVAINAPFYYLSTLSREKRLEAATSRRPGVYVLSYSLMSTEFGGEILDALEPEVFIGDEIQNVATYRTSARGRRFKAVVDKYKPQLIGLSGTITKKMPMEYHFLVTRALGENSFMPIPVTKAEEWSKVVDCEAGSYGSQDLTALDPLIRWAGEERSVVGARRAFRKRKNCAPGVVPVDEEALGTSLRIINHPLSEEDLMASDGYEELQRLLTQLNTLWLTPNGDEIDNALNTWMWRYWLEGFGFYYRRYWPDTETIARRKKISEGEAERLIERSMLSHERQQEYHRALRKWLRYRGRQGLDTPMLVGQNMHLHGSRDTGQELYDLWSEWKSSSEDIIERDSEAVRVCDFRVQQTITWMASQSEPGGCVWYYNDEVGKWIVEAAKEAGLPVVYCPSGKRYNELIEDQTNTDKWTIASIQAHHAGHNLQYHYWRCYYAQFPREAYLFEQATGRFHRKGQPRDTVEVHTSIGSDFDKALFSANMNDAAYAHQTDSAPYKIIYADYETPPEVVPYAVLKEWGASPRGDGKLF